MIQAADVGELNVFSPVLIQLIMNHRCRYRRERGQTSFARRGLFRHPIQPSDQTAHVARSKLVQAFGQTGSIRHPQGVDHLYHASRVLRHLLLRAYRFIPGLVDGWVCDRVYDGSSVFVGPG